MTLRREPGPSARGISRRELLRNSLAAAIGLWVAELGAGRWGSCGRAGRSPWRESRSARCPTSSPRTPACRSARASRRMFRPREPSSSSSIPPRAIPCRPGSEGRRHRAQRPGALPALPASGLPPEPVHRGLLVPLPVPPVPLRPARDEGPRRPVRSRPARHGSVRRIRRAERRADDRWDEADARTASDRAWPAGDHPAEDGQRLSLTR